MARACRHWALLLAAILLHPAAALAALDPTDVIQIQATTSLIRDNNLFRLPDVDPRLFGIDPANKADTTRVLGVGLKVDKLISRQRLIADININESTYDKNTNLDFVGGDGRLSWLWRVGNYWDGEVAYRKRRQLGGFADFRQNIQDLLNTDTFTLTGGYQFHPRWRVSGELTELDATHSAVGRRALDYTAKVVGAEVRYRTRTENSIGVLARRTDRTFPNRVSTGLVTFDNGHQENRLAAVTTWQISGAVRLDAQVGRVDVQHDQLSIRDFSGLVWRANASWGATSKLRVGLNTAKDVRLYEDFASSYIVANSVGISPVFAVTPKIVLQGDFTFERRDYRGDPGFVATTTNREDNVRVGRIGVTYSPIRNLDVSLTYETSDRKSTNALNNYDYQTWFGSIRFGF